MVQLDWKRLLSLSPEDLSEEEKDDLYSSLLWYNPEPNLDADHFKVLFRFTQDVMKYKGEQVESLVVELDDLAVRQGEEEARRHHSLIEEVEDLRAQLAATKRDGGSVSRDAEYEDLRQELVKCELHNEELLTELKARERDILGEKRETEKFAGQVAQLEREKAELQRELSALQSESSEHHSALQRTDSPEFSAEKHQEMADMIRQKNKHISQLLNDVETIEKENVMLREKLSTLRDELSEATKHMTEMTGELTGLKHTCQEQEEKMHLVEEQNVALRSQVQELVAQKLRRDSQLDDFSAALDSRVEEWKRLLDEKNAEIEELQARLSHLAAQAPNIQIDTERSRVALLTQTLQKREDQIEDLQKQLAQATVEMNDSAALIEELKSQKSKHRTPAGMDPSTVTKLKTQLQEVEEKSQLLESKLKDAEEDAKVKAQEATEMIIQLREYESGEYGLAEAVSEIKELRQQRRVRDKQIEELVQASNKLQAEAGHLEEQNLALREKLGLPTDSPVRVDGILAQRKKEQLLMKVLQQQAERLEEEKLQLKLENHKLSQKLSRLNQQVEALGQQPDVSTEDDVDTVSKISQSIVPSSLGKQSLSLEVIEEMHTDEEMRLLEGEKLRLHQDVVKLEDRLQEMTSENEALRKGMHEILDSIHKQDETSTVQVESKTLERLLEALDSRHLSGWYHPAMRLQAQLNSLEGSNAVLREQLRSTRLEESQTSQQLQKALIKIEQLEHTLATLQEGQVGTKGVMYQEMELPPDLPLSSAEIIAKLNMQMLHVLDEYHKEEEQNKILGKKVEEFNNNYNILRHQMGLLYKQYNTERNEWKKSQADFETEKEKLKENVESLQAMVKEYEEHWEALSKDEAEQKQLLAESAKRMALNMSNMKVLGRKCKALQNLENYLRKENSKLKDDMGSIECAVTQRIGELQRHKEMSTFRISALQSMLEDSVPLTTLEAANKQFSELTSKYRDLLQKEQSLVCESQLAARLEGEMEVLQKDKEELQNALQAAREKVHSLEVLMTALNQDTVTQDTHDNQISMLSKKLATIELKELNERQRADHADKMYNILKGQLAQLEERNAEVESQNSTVIQQNLELQQVERDLKENLLTFVSRNELQDVQEKLRKSEQERIELKLEKDKLLEIRDIAEEQVRNLELWKLSQEYQLDYMRRQILELQSTSDERSVIAKLNHELLSSRLSESSAHKKMQQLQNEISKVRSHNLRQETKLDEKEQALSHLRNQLTSRCRSLHQVIQDLRRQYSGAVPLATQERLSLSLRRLGEERRDAIERLRKAEKIAHEAVTAREEMKLQLKSLQELKTALESSDSSQKQLVEWHNKNTELRLKELKSRRETELLQSQLQQAEERLQRQEEHIATLEQEQIRTERNWEQAQLTWEQTQSELYKQLAEYENQQKVAVEIQKQVSVPEPTQSSTEPTTNSAVEQLKQALSLVSTQSQSLLKNEAELAQLRAKVATLTQELEEKDSLLLSREKALTEMKIQLASSQQKDVEQSPNILQQVQKVVADVQEHLNSNMQEPLKTIDKQPEEDSTEKLALKATINSLQIIVNQKVETIGRYQQLLKECRDEHSQAAARFQEEIRSLQSSLYSLEQSHNRLKSKLRHPSPSRKPVQNMVDQYIIQIQGLEDEVAELHTNVGNLSNQLHSCRQEADRWRNLAEDRLNNMGELRKRLEEQHSSELQTYQEEAKRYRLEAETAKQDLSLVQEQLQQQVEAAQKGPSVVMQNCITMLRAQLQDKEVKEQLLTQTVVDLQKEMKLLADLPTRDVTNETQLVSEGLSASRALQNEITNLRKQLKLSKDEANRLREHLNNRVRASSKREASLERKAAAQEEALQKKVKQLEEQLQEREKEKSDTEARKVKSAQEVARWDERKKWQQTIEKQKQKLKEKTSEVERLQTSVKSLRDLIARLEREKIVLEGHLKASKSASSSDTRLEALELEKSKLEVEGNTAVSEELEKLQETNATLQRANVKLESENLELRLDLEKYRADTPRLREQVQHLEKYVSLLKTETANHKNDSTVNSSDGVESKSRKSVTDLERTVIAMKRVVEKLQQENKRLLSAKKNSTAERKSSADKLKAELRVMQAEKKTLQEHFLESTERVKQLMEDLDKASVQIRLLQAQQDDTSELNLVRAQLVHKNQLLEKVKVLLQRAAAKEKILRDKVTALQHLLPDRSVPDCRGDSNV
ncbi:centrosomal protein of 290 kDa isoform X2 [Periplaneta americana]|uniref:centrosomal protein of 290 kDa isoform X2 n=1 Tax=Periplaneta americana TaxID=6978 RepID=UPI0037E8A78F